MGAQPQTALAIAVVPFGTDAKVEGTLYQMMAGALKILTAAGCSLVGGHTCEGDEAALGVPLLILKILNRMTKDGASNGFWVWVSGMDSVRCASAHLEHPYQIAQRLGHPIASGCWFQMWKLVCGHVTQALHGLCTFIEDGIYQKACGVWASDVEVDHCGYVTQARALRKEPLKPVACRRFAGDMLRRV